MFKQGAERVRINACVISVGIITDWLELSDVTAEAGSLCCHWGNRGMLPVVTRWTIRAGARCGNNGLNTHLHYCKVTT